MQYWVTIEFALHQSSYLICARNRSDVQSEPKDPEVKYTMRLHVCNVHNIRTVYTIMDFRYRNAISAGEEETAKTNTNRTYWLIRIVFVSLYMGTYNIMVFKYVLTCTVYFILCLQTTVDTIYRDTILSL
jgi:hypothetical protein